MKENEHSANRKRRAAIINKILKERYPDAGCTVDYTNALELLIATILSAQCTDERVNILTRDLFKKYKNAEDYMKVEISELEKDIRPTGFYRNKALRIKKACQKIVEDFDGEVPSTMEELITLPGVARKTANVVLGNVFHKAEGIVVDTHVWRVSNRLGLSDKNNADKIEKELCELIPGDEWISFGHRMIIHGRYVCKAKNPLCNECALKDLCPSREV
ncbi:MAG: endonuclease III [Fidelibacterota bacterium]